MPDAEPSVVDALNTLREVVADAKHAATVRVPDTATMLALRRAIHAEDALAVVETALADLRLKERTLTDYFEDASRRTEDAEARAVDAEAERDYANGIARKNAEDAAALRQALGQIRDNAECTIGNKAVSKHGKFCAYHVARAVLAGEEPTRPDCPQCGEPWPLHKAACDFPGEEPATKED